MESRSVEDVLTYSAMRVPGLFLAIVLLGSTCMAGSGNAVLRERRQRAAVAFPDGILLFHANSGLDLAADGFRQDPYFYYFTGLENTVAAVLAIDGTAGETWLFLPSHPPYLKSGLKPEVQPGAETAKRIGIEHVVDWSEMEQFFAAKASQSLPLYYAEDLSKFDDLPTNLLSAKSAEAPTWLQIILQKWPGFEAREASKQIQALMAVQNADEIDALRSAAKATVTAVMAGMRAILAGSFTAQRGAGVEDTCRKGRAHGSAFWPWAMSGDIAVFPRPFTSLARYDHLDKTMRSGELVRLDVGCEWNHYTGDLGRTVPVSGRYADDQRETWNIFVAAYHAGAKELRDGVTVDRVFDAWREVEPIASVDGQGFFLEDMYLVTKRGAELLTPGIPYWAKEIEAAMGGESRK